MQRPRRAPAARSARISGLLRRRPHLQEPGEGEIQQAQGQTEAQKETLTPDRSAGCRTARRRKTELEIEKATASDLTTVLGWLEREHAEDGDGFWCNRAIIERSLELEDLWVVRKGGEAVAFQVGIYAADIVSVRKDWRRKGLGDALFAASLERARIDGINVLSIECSPRSSWTFWQRHGFVRFGDMREFAKVTARRVLTRTFDVPPELPSAEVVISFILSAPPMAARKRHPSRPTRFGAAAWTMAPSCSNAGSSACDDEPEGRDLAVKIEVDGVVRCFSKAKYEEAEESGVVRDWKGGAFYVDAVEPCDPRA
jgi:GNAT superfamily N-acetyltransferase